MWFGLRWAAPFVSSAIHLFHAGITGQRAHKQQQRHTERKKESVVWRTVYIRMYQKCGRTRLNLSLLFVRGCLSYDVRICSGLSSPYLRILAKKWHIYRYLSACRDFLITVPLNTLIYLLISQPQVTRPSKSCFGRLLQKSQKLSTVYTR